LESVLNKTIYCIQGPTASGKTTLAIELALFLGTEIISADSRQFYQEMNIGTAKPTLEERKKVPHHFINNRSLTDPLNVVEFRKEAFPLLQSLLLTYSSAVVVGGSGQFVDALVEGLDEIPVFPDLRAKLQVQLERFGIKSLLDDLESLDPKVLANLDQCNPRRVLRALEIVKGSGQPWASFTSNRSLAPFNVKRYWVRWNRDELYERINGRIDAMVTAGLEREVLSLKQFRFCPAMNTLGYKEWFDFFEEISTRDEVLEKIKQHSRNYAKRQITWLNRYPNIYPLDPYSAIPLLDQIKQFP